VIVVIEFAEWRSPLPNKRFCHLHVARASDANAASLGTIAGWGLTEVNPMVEHHTATTSDCIEATFQFQVLLETPNACNQ
jgi:hypothetical protein